MRGIPRGCADDGRPARRCQIADGYGASAAGRAIVDSPRTFQVEADRHGLHLRSGLLTPGAARDFPPEAIARIHGKEAYSVNGVPRCRVVLVDTSGRQHPLTPVVGDAQEAEHIAADLRQALGLRDAPPA